MAPKRKGGRKKEEVSKEPETVDDIVPEHSREFYLIQIRDLEGRVARYQKKWDELQVSEDLFRTEYDKIVSDNREIVAFLKKTLNQRVDENAELSEQLHLVQLAKDTEKDAFETQLVQLRHEFQETKDQLTSENMVLSGKLASLEEFRVQKDDLMAKFADMEEQLKIQKAEHKEFVYSLEKKAVLDKERLKKEMLHRLNMVASEFRKVSNSQMAETTKRAIRENVTISLQLNKITDQSLQLMQENDRLKEACAEFTKQLDLLEQNEKMTAKKSLSNRKLIKMLTNKCKELQAQVDTYAQQQKVMTKLQEAKETLEKQTGALKAEIEAQKKEMQQKQMDLQAQTRLLQEEHQGRKNMELMLKHIAQSLKEIVGECPVEEDGQLNVSFHLWRDDMLQGLLNYLNKSIANFEEQQALRPVPTESKDLKWNVAAMDSSAERSLLHLKVSRIMSHCHLSKPASMSTHSMPSLSVFSKTDLQELARTSRSLTSMSLSEHRVSWKQETESRDKQEVIQEQPSVLETAGASFPSEETLRKPEEEEGAEELSPGAEEVSPGAESSPSE